MTPVFRQLFPRPAFLDYGFIRIDCLFMNSFGLRRFALSFVHDFFHFFPANTLSIGFGVR